MAVRKPTPSELLTLLAERAEGLRKAGVLAIHVEPGGGFKAELAPWNEPGEVGAGERTSTYADPLDDPATYPGGRLPGFQKPEPDEGDLS